MISIRLVLTVLAVAFTCTLAARGLWWTGPVENPAVLIASLVGYLAVSALAIFWGWDARDDEGATAGVRRADRLPVWACALALCCAAATPFLSLAAVGSAAQTALYATWYIGGYGALAAILVARRRLWAAWSVIVVTAGGSIAVLGLGDALALGLVGSVMWVAAAQFFSSALDRAERDTEALGEIQRQASAVQASHGSQRRERRQRVRNALAVAGPLLALIVAKEGALTEVERRETRVAEGRLRDELRGARLLDDEVRTALDTARRRGAVVSVLDEGGLDELSVDQLAAVRRELAAVLRSARSDRLFVRAAADGDVVVTVVGRSLSTLGLSDDDSVDLWREIERPGTDRAGRG